MPLQPLGDLYKPLDDITTLSQQRLLIFDTHPIQYRSPVFRALYQRLPNLEIFFFNERFDDKRWWFHEMGKIPKQVWELPLREGFPNTVLETAKQGWIGIWAKLEKILRHRSPAAIAVYGYYLPEHWMLRQLAAQKGIPLLFIGETFSLGNSTWRRWLKLPLQKYFFRGVAQFIAIGEKTEMFYRSFGISPSRIIPAKYCTDVSFFHLPPPLSEQTRTGWRKALGIPREAFVILFVGRLFERKRPWDVVQLHKRLKENTGLYTVIVGNGPLENSLRAEAEDSRVKFLGFQNQGATRDCYHGADLLVVPSEYETWGLVVNEAFACGLPALVTDTCGVAGDLVRDGETGFIYHVADLYGATEYVKRLLVEPALRRKMGNRAKEMVATNYSVEQFANAFMKALTTVTVTVTVTGK